MLSPELLELSELAKVFNGKRQLAWIVDYCGNQIKTGLEAAFLSFIECCTWPFT